MRELWGYEGAILSCLGCIASLCLQGKAGMEYLVRIAARLYAKKGINCNAVIPGLVLAGVW